MTPEEKIANLNLKIPINIESSNNELKFKGKVGIDISIEEAQEAGRICCMNALFYLKNLIGDLGKVKRIIKITGYVNCDQSFSDHPKVINGASDLLIKIFGEKGKHTRVAVGVNSLPLGSPVEVEFIIQI